MAAVTNTVTRVGQDVTEASYAELDISSKFSGTGALKIEAGKLIRASSETWLICQAISQVKLNQTLC